MLGMAVTNLFWGILVGVAIWTSTKDAGVAFAAGAATLCVSLSVTAGAMHIAGAIRSKS